jgi:hypothetical protein
MKRIASIFLLLMALTAATAWAQQPPPAGTAAATGAVDPVKAQTAAATAAEDLAVTRIIAELKLTPAQMRQLLPTLEAAQAKLAAQVAEAHRALTAYQPKLEEGRRALLAGKDASTRAEGQAAEQAQRSDAERRTLRADWVRAIRRSLGQVLTAQQQALLGEAAHRAAQREENARWYARAASGRGGGGQIGSIGRSLDRIRGASEAQYPEERFRIARRLVRMSEEGNRRPGSEERELSPTNPEDQRRLAPYYQLMDRVRQMPDSQYRQARGDLALQLWSARGDPGVSSTDREAAIGAMIDRYFLSPRMVAVMRQRTSQPAIAEAAAQETPVAALQEDLFILRAVAPLRLTAAQLGPLVQQLQAGQERLQAGETADAASWVSATRVLRQAIPAAAGGSMGRSIGRPPPPAPTTTADAEYARVQMLAQGKRNAARDQTRTEVRALLDRSLTPAQKAAIVSAGRVEVARQRMARLESGDLNRIEGAARELDRLREATAADWPQTRRRFAMQMANIPGGWEAGRGERRGNRSSRESQDGLRREQQRLRRQEARQETRAALENPAWRAQMQQFQTLADQVRAMPPSTFALQRSRLALKLYQAQSQVRGQTASAEEAMNAFIERYLLLPRAPVVLAERLRAMGA